MELEGVRTCSSCGVRLLGEGSTVYRCPSCGRSTVGRCYNCRDQSVQYECTECGFKGP